MINRTGLLTGSSRIAFAFAAGLLSTASLSGIAAADVIGAVVLEEYRGAVALPEAASDAREIRFQDQVSAMETVNTDDKGITSLQFLDQSRFDVGPNASVRLDEFVYDPASATGGGKISMAVGAFRYVGGTMKNEEEIKLVTPTATMTIRGSEVVIYVGIDGSSEGNVVSGELTVEPCNDGEPVKANPGERVLINVECTASVAAARPLADGFAALDVPDDIGEFATAAGGDGEGDNDGPPERDTRERPDPKPEPEPEPEPTPPESDSCGSECQ